MAQAVPLALFSPRGKILRGATLALVALAQILVLVVQGYITSLRWSLLSMRSLAAAR